MPPPPAKHSRYGPPSRFWVYRAEDGGELFRVCRFDQGAGEKVVLPLTPWRVGASLQWRWKAPPDPRPLYGLDRLAVRPAAPVLVVEGEKTADAAAGLFPDFAVVCWQGGSNAHGKADWSPLTGRRVAILPDADEPGLKAAKAVRGALVKLGVKTAGVIYLPDDLPKGWDVADEFPAGFSLDKLRGLVDQALTPPDDTTVAPDSEGLPAGFAMDGHGLWIQPRQDDKLPEWVSGPFEILGEARDHDGGGWSVVMKFKDRDGVEKIQVCPKGRLVTASTEIRRELADAGLALPRRSPNAADHLADFLLKVRTRNRIRLCPATGWAGAAFVLPDEVISSSSAEPALFTGEAKALRFGRCGTPEGWQAGVATYAQGNARAVFAISLALAGPLLKPLNLESGGFHLRGSSSCGKSTLAMVAGSIWGGGGPIGFAQSWRATANGLETIATGHSDAFLALDELGQLAPEEAGGAAYMLSNGMAKARLKSDGSARSRSSWRVLFLSTGEISLSDHIKAAKGGGNVMAGQEVRVIDLRADAGRGLGAWDDLHTYTTGAALSDAMKAAAKAHYGHLGPAFVRALVDGGEVVLDQARDIERRFIEAAMREGGTGQVHRGATRFAIVAAAGELAIRLGLLPWETDHAFGCTLSLFREWVAGFGRHALREETAIIRRVVDMIEQNRSRFGMADDEAWIEDAKEKSMRAGEARSLTTLGVFHRHENEDYYIFHRAGWAETFKGTDSGAAAKFLKAKSFLLCEDDKTTKKKSVKGSKVPMYWVRAEILEQDFEA